jgi:hypothetical protein
LGNVVTNASGAPRSGEATAEISSEPPGADIEIDGSFVGSTPSAVGIVAGEHTLRISKNGYKRWERDLKSSTGNIKIAAVLEPIAPDSEAPANSSAGMAEEARIGIWFSGSPTVKHNGLEISGVQPNGPADNIEVKPGDVLIAIEGRYLYTVDGLRAELRRHADGTRLGQYDTDTTDSPMTTISPSALNVRLRQIVAEPLLR